MKYSIIIPHKNSFTLLKRCIDSIGTMQELEIIVVDDCSVKDIIKEEIIDESKRENLKIIYLKESKGAGHARNVGVAAARGKWLLFADADDYFLENFYKIIDNFYNSAYDIVFFKAESRDSLTLDICNRSKDLNELVDNYSEKNNKLLKYMFYYPYCKLIRRDLVLKHSIKFDEIFLSNDVLFSVKAGHFAKKIHAHKEPIYCLTSSPDSLSKTKGEKIFDIRVETAIKVELFLKPYNVKHVSYGLWTYFIQARKFGIRKMMEIIKKGKENDISIFNGFIHWIRKKILR